MFSVILNYFASFNDDTRTDTFTKLIMSIVLHIVLILTFSILYYSYNVEYMVYIIVVYMIIIILDYTTFYVIRGGILNTDENKEKSTENKDTNKNTDKEDDNISNDDDTHIKSKTPHQTDTNELEEFNLNHADVLEPYDEREYVEPEIYEELQMKRYMQPPSDTTVSYVIEQYDESPHIENIGVNGFDVEKFVNDLNDEIYQEQMVEIQKSKETNEEDDDDIVNITDLKKRSDEIIKHSIILGFGMHVDKDKDENTEHINSRIEEINDDDDDDDDNGDTNDDDEIQIKENEDETNVTHEEE